MAKRSRNDFELSSPESPESEPAFSSDSLPTARLVVHPSISTTAPSTSTSKYQHLDSESGEAQTQASEMRCSLPPHGTLTFASYEEYDVHYAKMHMNRCLECRKNFPTEHFLNLHIEENHDAMVSVLRERGEKTYACFVEDCDKKCSAPAKRKMHLIAKHMFPKDYDFFVVNDGIDRRSSMLRSGRHRRRSSAQLIAGENEAKARQRSSTMETVEQNEVMKYESKTPPQEDSASSPPTSQDDPMEGLSGAMSALKFVPPSVRFGRGRGRGRGGFSRT